MASETWIHSQYECSAGTSWSLSVYSTVTARPRSSSTVVTSGSPIQRTFFFAARKPRYAPTATIEKAVENSYMLPQGARCTDSERGQHPAGVQQERQDGQRDGDPPVEVALLVAARRARGRRAGRRGGRPRSG